MYKNGVDFKIYEVATWLTNNCTMHTAQYLQRKHNQTMKFGQLIEHSTRNISE